MRGFEGSLPSRFEIGDDFVLAQQEKRVSGSLHLGSPTLNTWVNNERKKRYENSSEALAFRNITPGRVNESLLLTEIFAFSRTVAGEQLDTLESGRGRGHTAREGVKILVGGLGSESPLEWHFRHPPRVPTASPNPKTC